LGSYKTNSTIFNWSHTSWIVVALSLVLVHHWFLDADWGVDVDDRKSTTGYYIYLGSNLVSWSSHKQKNGFQKQY